MKERPIIFSDAMVRAILEGRKTQTRRIVKPQPAHYSVFEHFSTLGDYVFSDRSYVCPYGQPGDRLWVREAWQVTKNNDVTPSEVSGSIRWYGNPDHMKVVYRADADHAEDIDPWGRGRKKWRPSIHMPRQASRILLEITDVRVERVQEITEEACVEEGAAFMTSEDAAAFHLGGVQSAIDCFRGLWQSIHGPASWEQNPWVWVITFTKTIY